MEKINNTKMLAEQVENFRSEISSSSIANKLEVVARYTRLWKDQPELLEQYCTAEKILSYLK